MEQMEPEHSDISSLTEAQDKTLSLLPIFSGLLSAWGSFQIMQLVLCRRRMEEDHADTTDNSLQSYQRIMLGLSVSDLISSLALSLQAFLLPAETSQRIWAVGNDVTCSMMGFFQQLSLSNIWYTGMLSFLFLLAIRYSVSEERIAKVYEPWMHGLSIGFPLITASILAGMDVYGELDVVHWCWVTGEHEQAISFVVAGFPYFFWIMAIPINNAMVYFQVRRTIRNQNSASNKITATTQVANAGPGTVSSLPTSHESKFSNEQERDQQRDQQRLLAHQKEKQKRQSQRLQALAFQAFLYIAGFLLTQVPTVVLRVCVLAFQVTASNEAVYFPLLVAQAILKPLQGLFNYVVFTRTTYLREIE